MFGQTVEPEIGARIAPDRVGVVGVALGVVVFDEQVGSLEPVVVRLPGLEAACPSEVDLVEHVVDGIVRGVDFGERARRATGVQADQLP